MIFDRATLILFAVFLFLPASAQSQTTGPTSISVSEVMAALDNWQPDRNPPCQRRYKSSDYRYSRRDLLPMLETRYPNRFAPYTHRYIESTTSSLTIEHIVARKEAHISGLCNESSFRQMARDFSSNPDNLVFACSGVNSSKSSRDASRWPTGYTNIKNKPWFVLQVMQVKARYGLAIDPAERAAMKRILRQHAGDTIALHKPSRTTANTLVVCPSRCGEYCDRRAG